MPKNYWKSYLKSWGLKTPAARVKELTHVGLWPTAIKLNPLWKTKVSKSACIKPQNYIKTDPWMILLRDFQKLLANHHFLSFFMFTNHFVIFLFRLFVRTCSIWHWTGIYSKIKLLRNTILNFFTSLRTI